MRMQKRVKWERWERSVKIFKHYVRSKHGYGKLNFYLNIFFIFCFHVVVRDTWKESEGGVGE